jgi:flagellin
MNSVLTNTGAMTALQVLNQTNKSMGVTQARISTGLKVANAEQNAAIYAMAGVMKADVAGYETIQEGLGVAESGVSVGRAAAESIADVLQQIKTKVVSAQDGGVDRTKLQADIDQYKEQIKQIASSASFNGTNYLKGAGNVDILSSLNRSTTDGTSYDVSSSMISFQKENLVFGEAAATDVDVATQGSVAKAAASSVIDIDMQADIADNGDLSITVGGTTISIDLNTATGMSDIPTDFAADADVIATGSLTATVTSEGKLRITDARGRGITGVAFSNAAAGQVYNKTTVISQGSTKVDAVESDVTYGFDNLKTGGSTTYAAGLISTVTLTRADGTTVAVNTSADASMAAVATTLQAQLRAAAGGTAADYSVAWDATSGKLNVTDADGRGLALRFEGEGAGKLGGLATMDVTVGNGAGAKQALTDIEAMIQDTLDSAAALGSTQKRLSVQKDFLGKLVDAVNTGVGTLVDADMTQESARLQSLQVQQQLAAQALGIANQQPQSLLALFRG